MRVKVNTRRDNKRRRRRRRRDKTTRTETTETTRTETNNPKSIKGEEGKEKKEKKEKKENNEGETKTGDAKAETPTIPKVKSKMDLLIGSHVVLPDSSSDKEDNGYDSL